MNTTEEGHGIRLARSLKSAVIASFILMSAMATMASQVVLYDSQGFEPPLFSAGDLTGQDPTAEAGPWVHDGPGGSATVQTTVAFTGSQAVQIDRAAEAENRWAVITLAPTNSNGTVLVEWDMRVDAQTAVTNSFGPLMGIEAYNTNGTFALLGALYVDATTSDLITLDLDSLTTETGHQTTLGAWRHYAMQLDFTNNTYTVRQDNLDVDSRPFVDLGIAKTTSFTDASIAAIQGAAGFTAASLEATAYIDNYMVTEIYASFTADVNNDGMVDNLDITPFIDALTVGGRGEDPEAEAAFVNLVPGGCFVCADSNLDGFIDNLDITFFINDVSGIDADSLTIAEGGPTTLPAGHSANVLANGTDVAIPSPGGFRIDRLKATIDVDPPVTIEIPEPASLATLGLVSLGFIRRSVSARCRRPGCENRRNSKDGPPPEN